MNRWIGVILLICALLSSGCVGTVVGTAVDVTTAVIKVPFQVGGAIIDAASGDDEESEGSDD
ncbi:MAG: hypothetical protein D6703_02140 [Zetaproteobacteria bacterium]|nr:MAG: hypothetical protein D6703_02140 [Zetaproteobacteria bacterium]